MEGPIVSTLNVVFATDWLSETDESLEDQLQVAAQATTAAGRHGPGGSQRPGVCHGKQPAPVQHA